MGEETDKPLVIYLWGPAQLEMTEQEIREGYAAIGVDVAIIGTGYAVLTPEILEAELRSLDINKNRPVTFQIDFHGNFDLARGEEDLSHNMMAVKYCDDVSCYHKAESVEGFLEVIDDNFNNYSIFSNNCDGGMASEAIHLNCEEGTIFAATSGPYETSSMDKDKFFTYLKDKGPSEIDVSEGFNALSILDIYQRSNAFENNSPFVTVSEGKEYKSTNGPIYLSYEKLKYDFVGLPYEQKLEYLNKAKERLEIGENLSSGITEEKFNELSAQILNAENSYQLNFNNSQTVNRILREGFEGEFNQTQQQWNQEKQLFKTFFAEDNQDSIIEAISEASDKIPYFDIYYDELLKLADDFQYSEVKRFLQEDIIEKGLSGVGNTALHDLMNEAGGRYGEDPKYEENIELIRESIQKGFIPVPSEYTFSGFLNEMAINQDTETLKILLNQGIEVNERVISGFLGNSLVTESQLEDFENIKPSPEVDFFNKLQNPREHYVELIRLIEEEGFNINETDFRVIEKTIFIEQPDFERMLDLIKKNPLEYSGGDVSQLYAYHEALKHPELAEERVQALKDAGLKIGSSIIVSKNGKPEWFNESSGDDYQPTWNRIYKEYALQEGMTIEDAKTLTNELSIKREKLEVGGYVQNMMEKYGVDKFGKKPDFDSPIEEGKLRKRDFRIRKIVKNPKGFDDTLYSLLNVESEGNKKIVEKVLSKMAKSGIYIDDKYLSKFEENGIISKDDYLEKYNKAIDRGISSKIERFNEFNTSAKGDMGYNQEINEIISDLALAFDYEGIEQDFNKDNQNKPKGIVLS